MSEVSNEQEPSHSVISNRAMEIVVALALMGVAAVVMIDSYRLGAGWERTVGPQSGYFPFYVALILFGVSGVTLLQHVFVRRRDGEGSFIARHELMLVLQVLIPMTIFVVLTIYIGIYISTFLFIGFFMLWLGKYRYHTALAVALGVPVVLFVLFEIWFLVPLPKGPLEAWLGY